MTPLYHHPLQLHPQVNPVPLLDTQPRPKTVALTPQE
jgi:hypothetical protein